MNSSTGDLTLGLAELSAEENAYDPADLVTVARFNNPVEANIVRGCLQSEGLFVHLWGEHLGITHLFMSIAGGGLRIQVRRDEASRAKAILAAFERGDYALEE